MEPLPDNVVRDVNYHIRRSVEDDAKRALTGAQLGEWFAVANTVVTELLPLIAQAFSILVAASPTHPTTGQVATKVAELANQAAPTDEAAFGKGPAGM